MAKTGPPNEIVIAFALAFMALQAPSAISATAGGESRFLANGRQLALRSLGHVRLRDGHGFRVVGGPVVVRVAAREEAQDDGSTRFTEQPPSGRLRPGTPRRSLPSHRQQADQAGRRGGDGIVEFGGQGIANIYDYTYALDAVKIGEPVEVVVVRRGERVTLRIVPEARP